MDGRAVVQALVGVLLLAGTTLSGPAVGGAAATPDRGPTTTDDPAAAEVTTQRAGVSIPGFATRRVLDAGERYWQGWLVRFNATRIIENPRNTSADARTFQIRQVGSGGQIGALVARVTVNRSGIGYIDTAAISGRVVLQYRNDVIYVDDGVGYRSAPPGGPPVTVANSTWRVTRQTLEATWTERRVYNGQSTRLRLTSNREQSVVAVSSPRMNYTTLTRLFGARYYAPNHDARREQGQLLLNASAASTYIVNVSGVDIGARTLRFRAVDTTAAEETGVVVETPGGGTRFADIERVEQAGDLVEVEVICARTPCYLVLGGVREGVLDVVELGHRTRNESVPFRVTINTRYAGINTGATGVPSGVRIYSTQDPDAVARRYDPGTNFTSDYISEGFALSSLRQKLGLPVQGTDRPLTPGLYTLQLASTDRLATESQVTSTVGRINELVVQDERDARTLELTPPRLNGITVLTAPSNTGARLAMKTVPRLTTQTPRVAVGDWAVIEIEVSGVFGYLRANETDPVTALTDNRDEGLDLSIRIATPYGNPIDLARSRTRVFKDEANERLFVAIDTGRMYTPRRLDPNTTYAIEFRLKGVPDRVSEYSVTGQHFGYPYLAPGTQRQAKATVTFVTPDATIEPDQPANVTVPSEGTINITGTTTVAPGTILSVTATERGAGDPWIKSKTVVVDKSRQWRAMFEFTNVDPNEEFRLVVEYNGGVIARTVGRVVERPTPTETTTITTAATKTTTAEPTTTAPTTAVGPPTTTADDGGGLLAGLSGVLANLPVRAIGIVAVLFLAAGGIFVFLRRNY